MAALWIDRGNTAGKRESILAKIEERQKNVEEGKYRQILHIFPEGSTTNGEKIIKFQKGAFWSLRAVRPMTISYETQGMSPAHVGFGILKHMLLSTLSWWIVQTI